MSKIGTESEDVIGKWSEEKLDLLAKYLKAYSVIMNEQKKVGLKLTTILMLLQVQLNLEQKKMNNVT